MSLRHAAALAVGALTILASAPLKAQDAERPDLRGTWALSIDASEFGMAPAPDSAVLEIERADDHVVMTRTAYLASIGESTTGFDMPADGQTHQATTRDGPTDASLEWNGGALDVWIVAHSNVGDVDVSETWTVDDDGAQLIVDRLIEVPGMGEFEQTLVFEKRE